MRTGIVVAAVAALVAGLSITAGAADLSALAGNHPAQVDSIKATGSASPDQALSMEIRLALRNQAQLDRLLAEQQDPSSPNYRHWLTVDQFNRGFEPRQADVDAIAQWLKGLGFTVESANAADGFISFSGTVAQAQQAFATSIATFANGKYFANTSDPQVPSQFAGVIDAISGLDNMTIAVPASSSVRHPSPQTLKPASKAERRDPIQLAALEDAAPAPKTTMSASPDTRIGGTTAFGPSDLRSFYNENPLLSSATGTGQCIAIVGVSDISNAAVSGFNSQFSLPPLIPTRRMIKGGAGRTGDEGELEAELDVEWTHAAAPGAPVNLYLGGGSNGLVNAIVAAVNENKCGVISISFGFCGGTTALYTKTLGNPFKKAAATGQSVFVSSGDQGVAGIVFNPSVGCVVGSSPNPSEMAANPNVTAVGGTGFEPNYDGSGNNVGHVAESVWNDSGSGGGAGGGGISNIFAKPSYQVGTPNDGKRDIPDIALIASPEHPGVFLDNEAFSFPSGIVCCIGGTSLSAPVWAGFTRVISQFIGGRLGNINIGIYPLANQNLAGNGFRDVTTGNNSFNGVTGFSAGPGYDLATGWGTIDVVAFANAFKGLPIGTLKLAPLNLNFGKVKNGQQSLRAKLARLSNPAKNRLPANVTEIDIIPGIGTPPGAFVVDTATTTCGTVPTPPKKNCAIGIKFKPPLGSSGAMSATLSVKDNGSNSPQTAGLKGTAK